MESETTSPNKLCIDINQLTLQETQQLELPHHYDTIPNDVTSLLGCARWQVTNLLNKECNELLTIEEEDAIDDGFFLCDLNVVRNKLLVWNRLFPRISPFYAIKCNPNSMVAAVLGQMGASFDCASLAEIELALKSTSSPKRIVYANPQRAEHDLERALLHQVEALTFDGPEELYKVHAACAKLSVQPPSMILRILVPDEKSSVPLGEKFGASLETIESLTEVAVSLNLSIVGVSFHCGSGNHDPDSYINATKLAQSAMEIIGRVQGVPCWLLDIGGGYPGVDGIGGDGGRFSGAKSNVCGTVSGTNATETAANIATAVTPIVDDILASDKNLRVIAEPGRYFVEAAFALCSRIYRVQEEKDENDISRRHYYIAQGVQGVFKDCLLCNETFVPVPLRILNGDFKSGSNATCLSTVRGPSGEDYDVICSEVELPVLSIGDWLVFDRMGAYTISIAARHGQTPIRYVMGSCRANTQ